MLKTASNYINVIGALVYKGTWDASTNTPTLVSSVGNQGDYYVVSVAGNTNLNGITDWQVNDFAVFNGSVWQKIDNTDAVLSVNGKTGAVVLTASDVGATANTTYVLTSGLLSGGGQLNANVTVGLTTVPVANVTGAVPDTRTVSAGGLLTGGGALSSNVTISLANVPLANVTGAGTMASQNANAVAITGGTVNNATLSNATISSVAQTFPNNFLANSTTTLGNATLTLGSTTTTVGNLTLTGATVTGSVALTNTTAANATFATSSLPLVPEGYVIVSIGGVNKKIPYYGV